MARMRCSTSSRSKVESTAWPASYRTAIFAIPTDSIVRSKGGRRSESNWTVGCGDGDFDLLVWSGRECPLTPRSFPLARGANQPVGHQAEPEIHHHAQI